jgi:thiol-disulfide isomerase/thioredoxin
VKLYQIILFGIISGLIPTVKPVSSVNFSDVNLEVIETGDLKHIIKNRDNKPLFINVWATWCEPCREEFPEIITISKKFGDEIDIIGISVDFPEERDSKIVPFLKKQNAEFRNYVIKVVEPEDFINLLNKDWSGAVPATFVYDKKGIQKEFLLGKQSYSDFEKAVQKVTD